MYSGKSDGNFSYLAERGRHALAHDCYQEAIKYLSKAADGFKETEDLPNAGYQYKYLGDAYRGIYDLVTKGDLETMELDNTLFNCPSRKMIGLRSILKCAEDSYRRSRLAFCEGGLQTEAESVYVYENDMLMLSELERYRKYKRRTIRGVRRFIRGRKMLRSKPLLGFNSKWKSYRWLRRLRLACDYGSSPFKFIKWVLLVIVGFTIAYFPSRIGVIQLATQTGEPLWKSGWYGACQNLARAFYFSVTTFATLGYGDIYPRNIWAKLVTSFEAVVGYVMFGIIVALIMGKIRVSK